MIHTRRRLIAGLLAVPALGLAGGLAAPTPAGPDIRRMPPPHGLTPSRGAVSYEERETAGAQRHRVESGGRSRTYHLYAPGGALGPRPAIVLLHGARRTGRSMIDMAHRVADRHGVVLVAPDSTGSSWSPQDDPPGALVDVLRDAALRVPLQAGRLHLFGHSAGAILATLHANRAPGPWRSVVTHGGVLDAGAVVSAPHGPPIRAYLGTRDHLFPIAGAEATARALAAAGHRSELRLIEGHTHWFYELGPSLLKEAWGFMDAVTRRG